MQNFGLKDQSGQFRHKFGTWTTSNEIIFALKHLSLISYQLVSSLLFLIDFILRDLHLIAMISVCFTSGGSSSSGGTSESKDSGSGSGSGSSSSSSLRVFILARILVKIILRALHQESIQKHYRKCKQGNLFF